MVIARVAVSSLEPNPNPDPVEGAEDVDTEPPQSGLAPKVAPPAPPPPTAPQASDSPTILPPKKRRGRPPKKKDWGQIGPPPSQHVPGTSAGKGPTEAELAARDPLQPLYAKVGRLAVYGAREGKDLATFVHELRDAINAYDELLRKL